MWYTFYGWKYNPFVIKPNPELINYDSEKEELINYISGGDVCFLIGDAGIGKTSLLKWLELNLKKHFVVYINVEAIGQKFSIKEFLKKHTKFSRRLFGFDHPKNTVFLLDESKNIKEDLRRSLKLHFDENTIKSIVFCQQGQEPDMPEEFKSRVGNRIIKLNKLKEDKAFELVKKRCGKICPFTEGAINLILDKSNFISRKILETCEKVCIEFKGKKEITINDVQNLMRVKDDVKAISESLSPMEENIISVLRDNNKTAQELAELLKTTEGSVGKQLSKLMQKNMVKVISHKRPKIYSLHIN